jgi:Leucine-rich repeat (LRR) protein
MTIWWNWSNIIISIDNSPVVWCTLDETQVEKLNWLVSTGDLSAYDLDRNPLNSLTKSERCDNVKIIDWVWWQDIPMEIWNLTNLNELYLTRNSLTVLPIEIWKLTNLTYLSLYTNSLTVLPTEIWNLTNLTVLDLYDNSLTTLPSNISKLTNLQELWLWSNLFTILPPEIWNLTNLTVLDLRDNLLTTLPQDISKLINLQGLSLWGNSLTEIPPGIWNLINLDYLDLNPALLTSLPSEMSNLKNLTGLSLSGNDSLWNLSRRFGKWDDAFNVSQEWIPTEWQTMTISWWGWSNITISVDLPCMEQSELDTLKAVLSSEWLSVYKDVDYYQLDSSSTMTEWCNAKVAYWYGWATIPDAIWKLTKLTHLSLDNNSLTSLSPKIWDLINLTYLTLSNNWLTSLPEEIWNLTNLTGLDFSSNNDLWTISNYFNNESDYVSEYWIIVDSGSSCIRVPIYWVEPTYIDYGTDEISDGPCSEWYVNCDDKLTCDSIWTIDPTSVCYEYSCTWWKRISIVWNWTTIVIEIHTAS